MAGATAPWNQRGLTHGPYTAHLGSLAWPELVASCPPLGKTQDPNSTSQTRLRTRLKRQPGKFGVAVMHLVCYRHPLTGYSAHAINGCQVLQSQFPLHWNVIASTVRGLALKYIMLQSSFIVAILCYSWQHSSTRSYWESRSGEKINTEAKQENTNREQSRNRCKTEHSFKSKNVFSWRKRLEVCYSSPHQWKLKLLWEAPPSFPHSPSPLAAVLLPCYVLLLTSGWASPSTETWTLEPGGRFSLF